MRRVHYPTKTKAKRALSSVSSKTKKLFLDDYISIGDLQKVEDIVKRAMRKLN
jgi:hypothetical protein